MANADLQLLFLKINKEFKPIHVLNHFLNFLDDLKSLLIEHMVFSHYGFQKGATLELVNLKHLESTYTLYPKFPWI